MLIENPKHTHHMFYVGSNLYTSSLVTIYLGKFLVAFLFSSFLSSCLGILITENKNWPGFLPIFLYSGNTFILDLAFMLVLLLSGQYFYVYYFEVTFRLLSFWRSSYQPILWVFVSLIEIWEKMIVFCTDYLSLFISIKTFSMVWNRMMRSWKSIMLSKRSNQSLAGKWTPRITWFAWSTPC